MQIPLNELKRALKSLQSRYPEIRGLSMGKREKNGVHRLDQQDVIIIGVDKKIKHPIWSGRKQLPSKIWGIPTDIQEITDKPVNGPRQHLATEYIVSGNYGGSMGLFIEHRDYGIVGVTNRHVANLAPNSNWELIDNKGTPYCKPAEIAQENVDAALMKFHGIADQKTKPTQATQHIRWASPFIGAEVYYLGGRTNRDENGKVKMGTVLSMGWGMIVDPKMPDGVYTTVNFRFINLKGDTASPIPGDSGSPVMVDVYGEPFICGIVYAGGDRNQFCAAVPISNILDEFPKTHWGDAPIFSIPGFVRIEEFQRVEKSMENNWREYRKYARQAYKNQIHINQQDEYIKQLETTIKRLEEK